jgi:urease subunit beta
LLKKI